MALTLHSNATLIPLLLATLGSGCKLDTTGIDDAVGDDATDTATDTEASESGDESATTTDTTATNDATTDDTPNTTDATDSTETNDPPEPTHDQACGILLACMNICPEGELGCEQICLDAATMPAVDEYDAIAQCIVDNECQDDACIEAECDAELYACFTGNQVCGELLACADGCADMDCEFSCYYESTSLAQLQSKELQDCVVDNQCVDEMCIAENCDIELLTCAGGMSDSLPCPTVAECVLDCDGDDEVCIASCQESLNPSAQAEVPPLLECVDTEDCDDIECAQQACPDEWGTCISGEAECLEFGICFDGCAGVPLCEYVCQTETTFMGQVLFFALAECIDDNECDDEECVTEECGIEAAACGQ